MFKNLNFKSVSMIVGFLAHFFVLVWGASTISSATKENARMLDRVSERLSEVEGDVDRNERSIAELNTDIAVLGALKDLLREQTQEIQESQDND